MLYMLLCFQQLDRSACRMKALQRVFWQLMNKNMHKNAAHSYHTHMFSQNLRYSSQEQHVPCDVNKPGV
jgi:hypothetical protein